MRRLTHLEFGGADDRTEQDQEDTDKENLRIPSKKFVRRQDKLKSSSLLESSKTAVVHSDFIDIMTFLKKKSSCL